MQNKPKGWIYLIKNKINGKLYVGRTNNYQRRYNEHFRKIDTCTILRKAFEKYGKENFEMYPVLSFTAYDTNELDEVLNLLEKYYIKKYDTYRKGYNATLGGDGNCGWIPSEETRIRRSKSLQGRKLSEKDKERLRSYVLNRVWTKEQREKQRQNMLNRNPEIQKKVANKLRGKKRDAEVVLKTAAKRMKPIIQYSLDGKYLKEYAGAVAVQKYQEANITACCRGKLNSAYGYIWRYKTTDIIPMQIEAATNYHQSNKPIVQYDKLGNLIGEYKSATIASEVTGIGRKAITNCLGNRSKSAGGYVWKYKNNRREVA